MSDLHGYCGTITSEYEDGKVVVTALRKCCHCGYIWTVVPGSGKTRGFCTKCMGYCCGHAACTKRGCVPEMQGIENMETGRPDEYRPILVSSPGLPTG